MRCATIFAMDLELLERFLVLGEELHFGRAAERLHMAQPALSRQIRRLEADLGTPLLERTSRQVRLTPAGEALTARGPALLAEAARARAAVLAAASAAPLRVGFQAPHESSTAILERARALGVDAHALQYGFEDPSCGLRSGETAAAFLRLPIALDVQSIPIARDRRVAVLPSRHPLAVRTRLRIADLLEEPLVGKPPSDPVWRAFWYADEHRAGRPAPVAREARTVDEWLEAIAAGIGIGFAPESVTRFYGERDIVVRPVGGLSDATLALAWVDGEPSATLAELLGCAARYVDAAPLAAVAG